MGPLIRKIDDTWTLTSTEEDMKISLDLYLSKYTFKHKNNKLIFKSKAEAINCFKWIQNSTSLNEWGYKFTLDNKSIKYDITELQSMTFNDPSDYIVQPDQFQLDYHIVY